MTMLRHQSVSEKPHHGVYCGKPGVGVMEQTANVRDTTSQEIDGKSQPSQYLHGLAMASFA
jgi:hypothetical protein